jgi:hypothetical protein
VRRGDVSYAIKTRVTVVVVTRIVRGIVRGIPTAGRIAHGLRA